MLRPIAALSLSSALSSSCRIIVCALPRPAVKRLAGDHRHLHVAAPLTSFALEQFLGELRLDPRNAKKPMSSEQNSSEDRARRCERIELGSHRILLNYVVGARRRQGVT